MAGRVHCSLCAPASQRYRVVVVVVVHLNAGGPAGTRGEGTGRLRSGSDEDTEPEDGEGGNVVPWIPCGVVRSRAFATAAGTNRLPVERLLGHKNLYCSSPLFVFTDW